MEKIIVDFCMKSQSIKDLGIRISNKIAGGGGSFNKNDVPFIVALSFKKKENDKSV
jgi:hypothetical protein